MTPDEIAMVQRILVRLGQDPGPVDGIWGTRSRAALIAEAGRGSSVARMKMSARGIAALAHFEACVPGPYLDSADVWTWGIGHTAAAGDPDPQFLPRGMPADLDAEISEAIRQFGRDLARYEADVRSAFTVQLAQHEFDAAVSFHFNTGAIGRAEWVASVNRGHRDTAVAQIMNWRKPASIIKRREAERAMFAYGTYPDAPMTVWRVNAAGRVIWNPVKTVSASALEAIIGS